MASVLSHAMLARLEVTQIDGDTMATGVRALEVTPGLARRGATARTIRAL